MKKKNQKIKVVKSQSFIAGKELRKSLNDLRYVGESLSEWVKRKPKTRAALIMAVDDDKLCYYRMAYTKKFSESDNPDLAFGLHMGCLVAGADSGLYAALMTATTFAKDCWDKFKEETNHGKDNV